MLCSLFMLGGCVTNSAQKAQNTQNFEVANVTYDELWRAAHDMTKARMFLTAANKRAGLIEATSKSGLASSLGDYISIQITPANHGNGPFYVDIQSKEPLGLSFDKKPWPDILMAAIKNNLNTTAQFKPSYFIERRIHTVPAVPPIF